METKIIKNEEGKWKFPCKGICKEDNLIVGFSSYGKGTVINIGECEYYKLYDIKENWNMDNFKPIEEEKQPIDWDKIEFPLWAKDEKGNILIINSINNLVVAYSSLYIEAEKMVSTGQTFMAKKERNEWLNSLEIFPKESVIKITI